MLLPGLPRSVFLMYVWLAIGKTGINPVTVERFWQIICFFTTAKKLRLNIHVLIINYIPRELETGKQGFIKQLIAHVIRKVIHQESVPDLFHRCIVIQQLRMRFPFIFVTVKRHPVANDDIRSMFFRSGNHFFYHGRLNPVIWIHKCYFGPGCHFQTVIARAGHACIFLMNRPYLLVFSSVFITNLWTAVCRPIIHQNNLYVFICLIQ